MNANAYHLYASPRSPFARRIRLALRRLSIPHEEKLIDVFEENPDFLEINPLGMVPTLVTPDAGTLCDSANLLDYLHEKTGKIWPVDAASRIQAKQAAFLAYGLIQSTVLLFQETKMHETPSERWVKDHTETLERTLLYLSKLPEILWLQEGALTQAAWDLAVGLDYLSLRFSQIKWKDRYLSLLSIFNLARKDIHFLATEPKL
ncbi:MAG: glutathione S-transferase family protein [Bdellovibrionales bacterium]|nr:glutathione S-transferase family protein [Oligoflexia bacterium]